MLQDDKIGAVYNSNAIEGDALHDRWNRARHRAGTNDRWPLEDHLEGIDRIEPLHHTEDVARDREPESALMSNRLQATASPRVDSSRYRTLRTS